MGGARAQPRGRCSRHGARREDDAVAARADAIGHAVFSSAGHGRCCTVKLGASPTVPDGTPRHAVGARRMEQRCCVTRRTTRRKRSRSSASRINGRAGPRRRRTTWASCDCRVCVARGQCLTLDPRSSVDWPIALWTHRPVFPFTGPRSPRFRVILGTSHTHGDRPCPSIWYLVDLSLSHRRHFQGPHAETMCILSNVHARRGRACPVNTNDPLDGGGLTTPVCSASRGDGRQTSRATAVRVACTPAKRPLRRAQVRRGCRLSRRQLVRAATRCWIASAQSGGTLCTAGSCARGHAPLAARRLATRPTTMRVGKLPLLVAARRHRWKSLRATTGRVWRPCSRIHWRWEGVPVATKLWRAA